MALRSVRWEFYRRKQFLVALQYLQGVDYIHFPHQVLQKLCVVLTDAATLLHLAEQPVAVSDPPLGPVGNGRDRDHDLQNVLRNAIADLEENAVERRTLFRPRFELSQSHGKARLRDLCTEVLFLALAIQTPPHGMEICK